MRPWRELLVIAIFVAFVDAAPACKIIVDSQKNTIRKEMAEAQAVLFGQLEKARKIGDQGETDVVILDILKTHPLLKDRKVLTLPRFIANPDPKKPHTFMLFADVHKNKLEFYKGFAADQHCVNYVRDISNLDPKKPVETLRFYSDYLEHSNATIAEDAYLELARASDEMRSYSGSHVLGGNGFRAAS